MSTHDSSSPASTIRHAHTSQRSGAGGTLLVLLGAASIAGGVGLALLPLASWKARQVMEGLGQLGIHGGAFVIGGMGLMALGTLRRAIDAQRKDSAQDDSLLLEQLATDMAQLRNTLVGLEENSHQHSTALEALGAELATLQQNAPASQNSDALFQLASSLDKLGVRIDQRLKLHHSTLHDSLEELSATVDHSRRSLEERMATVAAASAGSPQPYTSIAPAHVQPPEYGAQSEHDVPQGYDAPQQTADAAPTRSLGLLDSFDDIGVAAPLPTIQREHGVDFDTLDQSTAELSRELDRAARPASGSWDEQFMVEERTASVSEGQHTQDKLAQLQSLLSDERLRAALEQMRRQG